MDVSPFWRRVAFGAIVCLLVGLGAYLIGPAALGAGRVAIPRSAGPGTSGSAAPGISSSPSPVSGSPAAATGSASGGQPDIYQWLPFTQTSLAAAASVVTRFGDAYGTYSYTQSPAAYGASLSPLTSAALGTQIQAAYSAPGVASARASSRQVATGIATIASISAFGPTSITFVVQVSQRTVSTTGTSEVRTDYLVTATGSAASWQVTSVQLASVGNS